MEKSISLSLRCDKAMLTTFECLVGRVRVVIVIHARFETIFVKQISDPSNTADLKHDVSRYNIG